MPGLRVPASGRIKATNRSSGFLPPLLSNLVIWLRADSGLTLDPSGNISQWLDMSGLGNNFSQSTANIRPSFLPAGVNGRPAARFNGSSTRMTAPSAANMNFGQTSLDLFIVGIPQRVSPTFEVLLGKCNATTANNIRYFSQSGTSPRVFYANDSAPNYPNLGSQLPAYISGAPTVWEWAINSAASKERYSIGSVTASGAITLSGTGNNSENMSLGSDTNPTYFAQWDIAEVILYNAFRTPAEISLINGYFQSRYGLPTS